MQIKRSAVVGILLVTLIASYGYITRNDDKIPVGINGVNHMGNRFSVREYYVNGHYASNIGREGGGGSHSCCMVLPSVWKSGMKVDLRWEEFDHQERRFKRFKAMVPVEKYDEPGEAVVHIFRDRSARFVSSDWDVMSPNHPVAWGDSDGGTLASKGQEISELFSEEELKKSEEKAGPRGSWR